MDDEPHYSIEVTGGSMSSKDCEVMVRSAVEAALRRFKVPRASVSLALVNDAYIAELNGRFLKHEGSTDVITFDLRDETRADEEVVPDAVVGEIVISTETAAREARARGHDTEREIALYAVHGVLHLIGFDDTEEDAAARMHALEDDILSAIGLGRVFGAGVTR